MDAITADFAGADRTLRLRFGDIIDVEQACGKIGIAALYQRFGTTTYFANDVRQVLKYGLIGGGMPAKEAADLVDAQIEAKPLAQLGALAMDVILACMTGIDHSDFGKTKDPEEPFDFGKVLHSLLQVGLSPEQVREMRYADFVALNRAAGGKVEPPSEDEFHEMMARWKERQT